MPPPPSLLRSVLRGRRRDLWLATALFSTHQLGESLVPVVVGAAVGAIAAGGRWTAVSAWLVALVVNFAVLSLSYRFGARAAARAKQHASHDARGRLVDGVLDPAGRVTVTPGDLLSRASSDADRVGAFAGVVASSVAAGVALAATTVFLLHASLLLGAATLVITLVVLVVQRLAVTTVRRRSADEQDERARAAALAEDLVTGLRILRGIGAAQEVAGQYRAASGAAARASVAAAAARARTSALANGLAGIELVVVTAAGGWLASTGRLAVGPLVAALGLSQLLAGPLQTLAAFPAAHARARASAARIAGPLTTSSAGTPPAPVAAPQKQPAPTDATLTAGSRGTLGLHGAVLAGAPVSVTVALGRATGIVCTDPLAAVELPAALARDLPAPGRLLLDGEDLSALPVDEARRRVVVARHEAALLPGTLGENLRVLAADADAVARSTHATTADLVVAGATGGETFHVGQRGERLSGGERQRILLARVLAALPPVLVLHDPTTAVDPVTEHTVAGRVTGDRAGRTTIVVTTSPAWLARCDEVVLVDAAGDDRGTHAELLDRSARYRELVLR